MRGCMQLLIPKANNAIICTLQPICLVPVTSDRSPQSSTMPPKKRKAQDAELGEPSSKKQKSSHPPLEVWGTAENPANAGKAFLSIPMELTTEILSHFPEIDAHTRIRSGYDPVLPIVYLQRPNILRALSQTCVAFRRVFLPLAWENLDVCVGPRVQCAFFKHAGVTLKRKSDGLLENKDLAKYVGCVPTPFPALIELTCSSG